MIDAASDDGTAAVARSCGARVLQQDDLLAEHGPALGKGDAMWRGLHATDGRDRVLSRRRHDRPRPARIFRGCSGPLLDRPVGVAGQGSVRSPAARLGDSRDASRGRPRHRAHGPPPAQPPRAAARRLRAAAGGRVRRPPVAAGVDPVCLGLRGRDRRPDRRAAAHAGSTRSPSAASAIRHNRHQPLRALGEMSYAVLAAVENRLGDRPQVVCGRYLRPWRDDSIAEVPVGERPPLSSLRSSRPSGLRGPARCGDDRAHAA